MPAQLSEEKNDKMKVGSSKDFASSRSNYQTILLLLIFLLDISIILHMAIINLGSGKMYFFYGAKYYLAYPNRPWTLAHAGIGTVPLLLSLSQISSVARKKSLQTHRLVGYLLIACGALQIPTTIYLGIKWADKEVVDIMRVLFVIFAFLWGLWGFAVLYYVRWKRDIERHRQWAVRFSVICHFVPIFGRMLVIVVWIFQGQPMDEDGRIQALRTAVWTLIALFVPFQEFFVWLECGICWFRSPCNSTVHDSGDQKSDDQQSLLHSRSSHFYDSMNRCM